MTQDHTIRQAYINTLLDGGFTRLADKTINPTEGYIVGGVTEPTTMGYITGVSLFRFSLAEMYDEFKELWLKYENMCDEDMNEGVGTWIHEGQIYFDVVELYDHVEDALVTAMERGEKAIYDCKNQKDIYC